MNRKETAFYIAAGLTAAVLLGGCAASSPKDSASEKASAASSSASSAAETAEIRLPTDEAEEVDAAVTADSLSDFIEIASYKGYRIEAPDDVPAENGMTVNISYEGTVGGEPFDAGSAENYDLMLGSGSFPGDFEKQLIGAKKGDRKELTVTYPKDYGSDDVAGKEVVYEVTVNSVLFETPDIAYARFLDGCRVLKYPASYLEAAEKAFVENYGAFLQSAGDLTAEDVRKAAGFDEKTYKSILLGAVKEKLAAEAVFAAEGISRDDEAYQEARDAVLKKNGYASLAEAETYGMTSSQLDESADKEIVQRILVKYESK